jgi:hypothetical protein
MSIDFDGQVYWFWNESTVRFEVDRVENNTPNYTTGTLQLQLWFTPTPYSGGTINGYVMGTHRLGELDVNEYYYDITATVRARPTPPDGFYYGVVTLEEFDRGEFLIVDWATDNKVFSIGNVFVPPPPPTPTPNPTFPGTLPPVDNDFGIDIYRFYNVLTKTHFYTASVAERNYVINALAQYQYEGNTFDTSPSGGNTSVYRFYNTATGAHFYTANAAERDQVIRTLPQFSYEGEAYKAFDRPFDAQGSHIALYRFYNTETKTHFYTADASEKAYVEATFPQFRYEFIAYYVDIA